MLISGLPRTSSREAAGGMPRLSADLYSDLRPLTSSFTSFFIGHSSLAAPRPYRHLPCKLKCLSSTRRARSPARIVSAAFNLFPLLPMSLLGMERIQGEEGYLGGGQRNVPVRMDSRGRKDTKASNVPHRPRLSAPANMAMTEPARG